MKRTCFFLLLAAAGPALGDVRINEFLADNTSTTLEDEDRETPDWIELHNPDPTAVDLEGWHLTDDAGDLTKWTLPAVTIPANGYLVVFASGKDRGPTNGDPLHTNFVLAQTGEYLALVAPPGDSGAIRSEFGTADDPFPNQRPGISYGYFGAPEQVGFMFEPTPGAANEASSAVLGFVGDTEFSIDRGFFTETFNVEITTSTPDAEIRYTMDGSWPTETEGILYTGPVAIRRTLPLKAIAYKEGFVSSNVDTQTYIFVDDVVTQTSTNTQSVWGFPSSWNGQSPYYGMDGNRNIDPVSHRTIREDLQLVPSMCISMESEDLFGGAGIYSHPQSSGVTWERKTSLEFIDPSQPDGNANFQQNCAIRIQGGAFRGFGLTRKKSFRVLFKSDYGQEGLPTGGAGKLDYPLFGPDATSEFQTLVFRMESNDGWQWSGAGGQPLYARDEFGRRAQLALGQPASHGRYCHLYLNGVYWGLYNVVERPDSGFAESYLGARRDRWQGQNSGQGINDNNSLADWNGMLDVVDDLSATNDDTVRDRLYLRACGFDSDGEKSDRNQVWIDPDNLADYLLVNWYGGNSDWPHKNYYCGRARESNSTGYKFFMWDAEWSLFLRSSLGTNQTSNFAGVAAPQQHLERSPEYRLRFGDRAHAALFNDGVFTPDKANALWEEITDDHLRILNPEAARWGNQHGGAYSVANWRTENRRMVHPSNGWFAQRAPILVSQLQARGLYPDLDAPTYSPHGGSVPAGSGPSLSVPDNITKIYYMFGPDDGTSANYTHPLDPRLLGGEINPAATLIDFGAAGNGSGTNTSAELALTEPGFLYSRSYDSRTGEWSALNTALFTIETVPADATNIVISEIHYHPAAPTAAETAAGFDDQDLFEFLEVQNISASNVDMSNVDFIDGVQFVFAPGFTIAPGERVVIVKDPGAFAFRYPDVPSRSVAGAFLDDGNLRNSGEMLTLRAADGSTIKSFAYDDEAPWPVEADGLTGVSLVLIAPDTNPDHSLVSSWRVSNSPGGTPGSHDDGGGGGFVGNPAADDDGDGLRAYLEYAIGTSDLAANDADLFSFGVESIDGGDGMRDYMTVSFQRSLAADDVELIPQASNDLQDWEDAALDLIFVSEQPLDATTALLTYRTSLPLDEQERLFVRLLAQAR